MATETAGDDAQSATVDDLVASGQLGSVHAGETVGRLDEVSLEPPILAPQKIVCIGLNYRSHAEEQGAEPPSQPTFFAKFRNALAAPGATVPLPRLSAKVDYEAEVAFVVGRRCKDVPEERALDCIAGYTLFNDLSARDLQFATPQWMPGKVFDGSAPMGPALVTPDEAGSHDAIVGELNQVGPSDPHAQVPPGPAAVRGTGHTELGRGMFAVAAQQGQRPVVGQEQQGTLRGASGFEQRLHQRGKATPGAARVQADERGTRRAVTDAVGPAQMPGNPPQPHIRVPDCDGFSPVAAVHREPGQRLVTRARGLVQSSGGRQHQTVVRCDAQLGIAEVGARAGQQGGRSPHLAVCRTQHANHAVVGDVAAALTKDAIPALLETSQVREGIVRRAAPDQPNLGQFRARSRGAGPDRKRCGEGHGLHTMMHGG
ncbi:MAG: fumarylacetoacetate hydrolase family protein [Thermoleophilum sp.]|nr:fumarylacetoacetate hydrolase family protein [Thermoleophilum sp.]